MMPFKVETEHNMQAIWPWCLAFYLQSVDMECARFNIQQNSQQNIQQNI